MATTVADMFHGNNGDKRAVSFALDKNSFISPSRSNRRLKKRNMAKVYYTRDDLSGFREGANEVVRKLKQNLRIQESDEFCFRGLECRTIHGARRTSANRIRAKNAVLQEQSRQKETRDFDAEMLAEVYKGYSITSVCQAQRIARADAQFSLVLKQELMLGRAPSNCYSGKNYEIETSSTVSMAESLWTV